MLDAAPEHAAAQKERVGTQQVSPPLGDDETDEAVVAEAIADAHGPDLVPPAGHQRLQLGLVTPDGREVELIGAQRELRGATQIVCRQRREVDDEARGCR